MLNLRERLLPSDDEPAIDPSGGIEPDSLLEVLSNPRRRQVIRELADRPEPMELGELTDRVAAAEYDVAREALESQQRKRVYVSLYQVHIPHLADAGLCVWASEQTTVESAAGTELARAVLDDVDARLGVEA